LPGFTAIDPGTVDPKVAKQAEKAKQQAIKKSQAVATKALGNLAALSSKLQPVVNSKSFEELPECLTSKVNDLMAEMKTIKKQCEQCISKGEALADSIQGQIKILQDKAAQQVQYLKAVLAASAKL
jgi:hypothetical protein